jgi:hypothetical protein
MLVPLNGKQRYPFPNLSNRGRKGEAGCVVHGINSKLRHAVNPTVHLHYLSTPNPMVSLRSNSHMRLTRTFVVMKALPERVPQTLIGEAERKNCSLAQVEGVAKMKSSPGAVDPWTMLTWTARDPPRKGSMV